MMSVILRFTPALGESLLAHLRAAPEGVAFLRGRQAPEPDVFHVETLLKLTARDLDVDSLHVALTDRGRQRVLAWVAASSDIVIEAHSHGRLGDPAVFSIVDLDGLSQWVPHVRWRMRNRPYAALVLGFSTFDGLAWLDGGAPVAVSRVEIGAQVHAATGRTIEALAVTKLRRISDA